MTSTKQTIQEAATEIAKAPITVATGLFNARGAFAAAAVTIIAIPATIVSAFKETAENMFANPVAQKADPYASLDRD